MKRDRVVELIRLHEEIDRAVSELTAVHGPRLRCRGGCCDCCRDDLTVFAVEAERIRRHCAELLAVGRPHPAGACAFLDEAGACRIYAHRPYVCRTQGLPLRWLAELTGDGLGEDARVPAEPPGEDARVQAGPPSEILPALVEYRDICPLNEPGPPIEELPESHCWTLGPTEERLRALQESHPAGPGARVALRGLFAGGARRDYQTR